MIVNVQTLKRGKGNERVANILRQQRFSHGLDIIFKNSPACMPKGSKDYEIKKNKSRDLQPLSLVKMP